MPIPKPNTGESESGYMSRCIQFVTGEGTPNEQAVAICATQWSNRKMKGNLKTQPMQYKSCISLVKDIDEKGFIRFHASIFNTPDRVKDIVDPGAYTKTINENFKEIQHYKNHDSSLMPGVLHELKEDSIGLDVLSKLILKTQLGMETYEEYKAMAEAGKSMGHSIGYRTVRDTPDNDGFNHLKEIALFEVSSLTKRAAHPDALTTGIKSLEDIDFEELLIEESFYKNLLNCKFTDAKLERLEEVKDHITALIESRRKSAPDYNDAPLQSTIELKTFKF